MVILNQFTVLFAEYDEIPLYTIEKCSYEGLNLREQPKHNLNKPHERNTLSYAALCKGRNDYSFQVPRSSIIIQKVSLSIY